jgi:hypothetical protein
MSYCPSCGSENEDWAAFCSNCGNSLQVNQQTYQTQETHMDPTYPEIPPQAPPPYSPAPRKRTGAAIGAIIIVAILIIAAVVIFVPDFPFGRKTPTLIAPADGTTVDGHYPTFTWTTVSNAQGYEIAVLEEGDILVIGGEVQSTSFDSISYLDDGIYEWSVRARVGNSWSGWSETCIFFVGSSTLNRHYEWQFDGRSWSWDMMIPASQYYYYKDQVRTYDYASYMTENDDYIESLTQELKDYADSEGWSSFKLVSFTLAFVQSLEYTSDSVTTGFDEYPRYPIETLVDEGGDCEDTSVLFATLIQADPMNIDAVLLILPANNPEHMAAGVAGGNGIQGAYYEYDGRNYYYCETTGEGWMVGDIPDDYQYVTVRVIQV